MTRAEIAEHVHAMLRQVGLEGMGNKYPSELSGGMQKRVALARALIHRLKILMLDEPTTGLDPTRTRAIHQLVRHTQQSFPSDSLSASSSALSLGNLPSSSSGAAVLTCSIAFLRTSAKTSVRSTRLGGTGRGSSACIGYTCGWPWLAAGAINRGVR